MSSSMKKLLYLLISLIIIIALITLFCITSVGNNIIRIMSIGDISKTSVEVSKSNNSLEGLNTTYNNKKVDLAKAKSDYQTEKSKYEAISNETVSIIEDANKDVKYSIEYLWIVLGNYAKSNSLTLTVVEPGSKVTGDQSKNIATTTTGTASTSTTTGSAPKVKVKDKVITIQVRGNYLNVADFVFEVENDKTLRFKLDNISMSIASGKDIIASFEVKNLVVLK